MSSIYIILDDHGAEVKRIVADQSYVEDRYPGRWELFGPLPIPEPANEPVRIDTPLFIMRFTPQERVAMRAAAKADTDHAPLIDDWLAILNDPRLAYVELGDPNLIAAMTMMVSLGLLTQQRADEILSP